MITKSYVAWRELDVYEFERITMVTVYRLSLDKQTADDVTVSFGKTTAILQAAPLRIDLIRDNDVIMSINSRGLFKFEHTRSKENK